jgi:hypothetical protein
VAHALVAQLDRASDYESGGRTFESCRARQKIHMRYLSLTYGSVSIMHYFWVAKTEYSDFQSHVSVLEQQRYF